MTPRESTPATLWLLWTRFTLRHWRQAPRQSLLLVAILALGVSVYLSIRLANRAAVAGFENFTETVTGRSDFILQPPAGVLDESALATMRRALGPEPVALVPVIETTATRPRPPGTEESIDESFGREAFQVVGVDLIASANLAGSRSRADPEAMRPTGSAHAVWITAALAARDRLAPGGTLSLIFDDSIVPLEIAGVLPEVEGLPTPSTTLVVMDLPDLQRLLHRTGRIDRVEVVLPAGPDAAARRTAVRDALESASDGRWEVITPESRRATGETMTAAFRLNLTVLSLIALLVGLLLILQALDGAVVRRRQEIAILRSLGVESRVVQLAWLLEAATLGALGGLAGAFLGWAGAQLAVRFVARTVDQLYYANTVDAAALAPAELLGALVLGVLASVLAGWVPARAAAGTPPAQMLGRGHIATGLRFLARRWPGPLLIAAGCALVFVPPLRLAGGVHFPLAGYGAALCWILGAGLLGPALLRPIAALGRHVAATRPTLALARTHLRHITGRHRLAAAGLITATGMTAGMIVLVGSFEHTLRGWIDRSLRADLFIASDGAQNASARGRLTPALWTEIATDPAVAGAELFQGYAVQVDGKPTFLGGYEYRGRLPEKDLPWIVPPAVAPAALEAHPDLAYASESFSERFSVARGSRVEVPTPAGPRSLEIAGIFADYGSDRGSLLVARTRLVEWFQDESIINMAVHVAAGHTAEDLRARLLTAHPGLRVMANADLRGRILTIFRQTFSITYALELIGVVVAVAGLGLMLASILLDRRDQLTTLRALGMTHREIAAVAAWEGAGTALAGVATGLALSLALGWLLVFVINKQSFGWTLQYVVPAAPLALLAVTVIGTATLASWFVGRRGAMLPADREE